MKLHIATAASIVVDEEYVAEHIIDFLEGDVSKVESNKRGVVVHLLEPDYLPCSTLEVIAKSCGIATSGIKLVAISKNKFAISIDMPTATIKLPPSYVPEED